MAAVNDCFSIGSTVVCTTCFNQNIEGEVLAFDQSTKILILKCTAVSGNVKQHDVFMVNLSLCGDVQVKKEVSTKPDPPQSLNLQRLTTRLRNTLEQKKRLVTALAAGVSPDGQKLFIAISKTIDQVTWSGPNIVVFNDVTISPPYKVDNVAGNPDSKQLTYVKKIVEKYLTDSAATSSATNNQGIPAVSAN
ncbi:LSM12 homolog A [Phlebotomus argentipes]|uniref:LSM12 homolog A n=1 Tax=Phlebotomus argentipes TaxID=94469 RepID=UPI002892AF1B|nr:LSM12 homolog A [Phlebotomus argentipes]